MPAVRPRDQTSPLGKVGVRQRIVFRWGRPMPDWAQLAVPMKPRKLAAARIPLEAVNEGVVAPERGEIVSSKVIFL